MTIGIPKTEKSRLMNNFLKKIKATAMEVAEAGRNGNPALSSYRNAQSTLGSFYQDNNSETMELRRQLDEMKEKLAEKDVPPVATVDDQLKLMEKSYEMAAKYLPKNTTTENATPANGAVPGAVSAAGTNQKEHFVSFTPARKNTVSALYREPTDSAFLADWSQTKNRGFYTAGSVEQVIQPKNSIKACIHDAQTVVGETGVRLKRLLKPTTTNEPFQKKRNDCDRQMPNFRMAGYN